MSEKKEEKKKKPKIDYHLSENGNVIDASIDDNTHFISFRKTTEKKKKGGLSILPGFKGEAEKQQKDEWLGLVWERGAVMPQSVWDEKKRKELLENMRATISTATASAPDTILISGQTGTVIPWNELKTCPKCKNNIALLSKYCPMCGEQQ